VASRCRVLRISALVAASVLLLLILVLALIDLDVFRHPLERMASARSGRTVTIAGRMTGHLWSWTPGISLTGLTIGNPPWEPARPMVEVQRLDLRLRLLPLLRGRIVLERLQLDHPQVYLHRDSGGRANWTFASQQPSDEPAAAPTRLPLIRNFIIDAGQLTVRDEILHLDVRAEVQAHEQATATDPHAFHFDGQGTVNKQPLSLSATGGPLIELNPDHPYPFALNLTAGNTHVESDGVVRKPFDFGLMSLTIRATGSDLADLYYLTQLAFPNTPPFKLQATVDRDGNELHVNQLLGQVGASDLSGQLDVDISRKRPMVKGTLVSRQLRLRDLAASLGGKSSGAGSEEAQHSLSRTEQPQRAPRAPVATAPVSARLFPDARLQVNRVRAMNADVQFTATAIEGGNVPLQQVALHIRLNDGVLSLEPFEFQMPQGKLHGTVHIDARGAVPDTQLDLRISDIELAQLKGNGANATAPLAGDLQARIVARGKGDSVHDFVAGADGTVTFILPHGEVREALAELTGVDLVQGLGLLLKGSEQRTEIRCGVAQFALTDGTMKAQNFLIDTTNVQITGSGVVQLGPEELDLALKGDPKKLRFGRLRTPIKVEGHLLKPKIGVNLTQTLKQGAIATAIGAVFAPLAAVIAFVDPGLAKNADCASLLATAQQSPGAPTAATVKSGAR
jgi:uncharacterized protein involved in outer membrane biogenesis